MEYTEYKGKYLTIMLCSGCNQKCKHCYVNYHGRFTDKQLAEMIPSLSERYSIMFNGTEPILYPEYFKYFQMINQNKMFTNGLELMRNYDITQELLKYGINYLSISYHFGIHDQISSVNTKDLEDLFKRLKNDGFKVRLLCTLNKDNYKNTSEFCKQAKDMGVDGIKFTNLIIQGNASENLEGTQLGTYDRIQVLNSVNLSRRFYDKEEFNIERCGSFGNPIHSHNFECFAGTKMVVLTPDNKIYQCIFDIGDGNEIGYLDESNNILINPSLIDQDRSRCKMQRKYNK